MKTGDLLSKGLGSKGSNEGATNVAPSQSSVKSEDLLAQANKTDEIKSSASKSETSASVQTNIEQTESNSASKVETSGSNTDPNSWTLDNALKEIKKLREENKMTRVKYSESVEKLKSDSDARIIQREQELQELVNKAQELEQIKAKEEDRKRDLSEKLAHREARIAELQAKADAEKKAAEDRIKQLESVANQYKAESEAQLEVYKQRLSSELESVPDKYKDIASYIVKGAGDPRDALVALNEAKLRGVFDDKTVVVSHSVPGAANGARATKESLDAAAQAQREKLSSMEKIREGLKQVRTGEGNSAFRIR